MYINGMEIQAKSKCKINVSMNKDKYDLAFLFQK